jgi:hypothetical protein
MKEEKGIAIVVSPRMMRFLFNIGFMFEPLAPTAISYFTGRTLHGWQQQGLIDGYKTRTKRLGKFHYKVIVDLDVNEAQAHHFFAHVLPKQSKTLGRWLNG